MYGMSDDKEKKFSNKDIFAMVIAAVELLMPYFIILALGLALLLLLFQIFM